LKFTQICMIVWTLCTSSHLYLWLNADDAVFNFRFNLSCTHEWLRSLTSNHLPHTAVFRIPTRILESFMWGCYQASLRNICGSTQVSVRAWNNARKGTWGLPPPVNLERGHMTYTVLVGPKTHLNSQTNCLLRNVLKLKYLSILFSINLMVSSISTLAGLGNNLKYLHTFFIKQISI
jgi:hypothetical protein